MDHGLRIESGAIVALRLVDFAYDIDLQKVEALWERQGQVPGRRVHLSTIPSKAMFFGVAPVLLHLGPVVVRPGGRQVEGSVDVRLYDFGVASFSVCIPAENVDWHRFSALANELDAVIGPSAPADFWDELVARVKGLLDGAITRAAVTTLQEDYLLAVVNSFNEKIIADELLQRVDLVPLLTGEQQPLSDTARQDVLRYRFSYYPDDLAVITWDRAFLYEPRQDTDVADVLEMANAQLLEMRTYDAMLNAEMPRLQLVVGAPRTPLSLLTARHYARVARQLHTLVAEITLLTEKVDNALQVTEDVYLARVYTAAMGLFRVAAVGAAVDRKLSSLKDTYAALQHESAVARAEALELIIVILIGFEIILSITDRLAIP